MIEPKELRIGNLVKYIGTPYPAYPLRNGIVTVEQVLHDGVNLSQGDSTLYESELLEGISLIPEWLELCGLPNDLSTIDAGGNYSLVFERREDKLFLVSSSAMESEIIRQIEYLHIFQNLYLDLIGEELNINQ